MELPIPGALPRHHEDLEASVPPQATRPPRRSGFGDAQTGEITLQSEGQGEAASRCPTHDHFDTTYCLRGGLGMTIKGEGHWAGLGSHG